MWPKRKRGCLLQQRVQFGLSISALGERQSEVQREHPPTAFGIFTRPCVLRATAGSPLVLNLPLVLNMSCLEHKASVQREAPHRG
jgi:hypothetical protein